MTVTEVIKALSVLTHEKTFRHNIKNGADEHQFGVKLGDIRTLAKKIKVDHALGMALFDQQNLESRLLATLIVDPKQISISEMDRLVRLFTFSQLADWFNAYVVKEHPEKETLRQMWMASGDKMALRAGWSLTTGRIVREPEGLDLDALLDRIEAEMMVSPPEAQWTMNMALGQIGIYHPKHRERAIAIGEKLGIYRDFPVSKGCTSPFVPIWIAEMVRRGA